jgi:hypothetical protein
MLWFVENAPDSKFSGEYHCFLDPNDANYFRLREAWLKQLKHSESLARRVNAFMFLLHGKEPDLSNRFKRMFSGYERSVHVQALDAFLKRSSTWVEKLARAQLERRLPPLAKVKRLTLFANDQELIPVAATAFGSATKAEFLESIERLKKHPEDMHARAIALGYTFSYHSFSPFELDPELTMLRFDQLCWVIRYIPGSQLAGNPFGMDPISHGPVGRFFNVDPLNEALASLWSDQIDKQIDDDRLLFNAAIFGQRTRTKSASKMISMQLRKTPLGKKMLSKAYSHY